MPSYNVTGRKTMPVTTVTVDAPSREHAIAQVVAQGEEGEEFQVMTTEEAPATDPGAPIDARKK